MLKIVTIGGGSGQSALLNKLKDLPVQIKAIVTTMDSGGSTGKIRQDFKTIAYGDIRNCLVALTKSDSVYRELFKYRFDKGELKGHNFGNLFILALNQVLKSDEKAIKKTAEILQISGEVLPITYKSTNVYAKLEDGSIIEGETNIDVPKHNGNLKIIECYLKPKIETTPAVKEAIKNADVIVITPGDFYSSIIPNLCVGGVSEATKNSKAKKIYIASPVAKWGETTGFTLQDFVQNLEKYLGKKVLNYLVYQNKPIETRLMKQHQLIKLHQNCREVKFDNKMIQDIEKNGIKTVGLDFVDHKAEKIKSDCQKLAKIIYQLGVK